MGSVAYKESVSYTVQGRAEEKRNGREAVEKEMGERPAALHSSRLKTKKEEQSAVLGRGNKAAL